uniref:hypothetical protein n=1 Tax=Pedobacter schmidteae TaxID=2201271 RepID=UPI000EB06D07|nr:hypothetical protein [Pedobacter schmidteae]
MEMIQGINVGLKQDLDIMEAKSKYKMMFFLSAVGIALVIFLGYKLLTFNLFDDENVKLKSIIVPDREYRLDLYYVPANASNQSYIQVRQIKNTKEYILKSYDRYNYLVSNSISGGQLKLILKDTSLTNANADTVVLELPR